MQHCSRWLPEPRRTRDQRCGQWWWWGRGDAWLYLSKRGAAALVTWGGQETGNEEKRRAAERRRKPRAKGREEEEHQEEEADDEATQTDAQTLEKLAAIGVCPQSYEWLRGDYASASCGNTPAIRHSEMP